jgi:hypothetical protein
MNHPVIDARAAEGWETHKVNEVNRMSRNESVVKLKSERELRFYRWFYQYEPAILTYHLKSAVNSLNINHLYSLDNRQASRVINSAVRSFYHPEIANGFIRAIRMNVTERFVPSRDFAWIKNCPDACYYVWLVIRTINIKTPSLFSTFTDAQIYGNPPISQILTYDQLDLIQYPANHTERMFTITDFFDRCDLDLKGKIELMNAIRTEWYRLYTYKDKFPLNKKEKEKCEWAWKYFQKDRSSIKEGAKKRKQNKESEKERQESSTSQNSSFIMDYQNIHHPSHIRTLTQAAQYIPQQYPASNLTQLAQYHPSAIRHDEYNANGPLKNMIESSAYINTATLMPYLKPASNAEKCLIIHCLYTCWYHKDSDFIKRFNKAWEGRNARKKSRSQKKSKVSPENIVPDDNNVITSQITTQPCVELPHEKTRPEAPGALNENSSPLPADEDMDDKDNGNHPFMWMPY